MSTPTSFRLPFVLSPDVHPEVQKAIQYAFSGLKDVNDAIAAMVPKLNATTTVVAQTGGGGVSGGSGSTSASSIGVVNEQSTGSYTLDSGDFGAIVVLDTAATFAVTLASAVTPFYAIISNQCAGQATLTPANSAKVNGVLNWPVPPGGFSIVAFDGINWWAAPVCPQNTPPIPHNYITGYDSANGEFTQSPIVLDSSVILTDVTLRGTNILDSGASIICDSGSTIVFDSGAAIVNGTLEGMTSIRNLLIFANNAAAIAGGLIAGNLYRDGSDPDHVCITH